MSISTTSIPVRTRSPRRRLLLVGALSAVLALGLSVPALSAAADRPTGDGSAKPTIVLVHGCWADSSGAAPEPAFSPSPPRGRTRRR